MSSIGSLTECVGDRSLGSPSLDDIWARSKRRRDKRAGLLNRSSRSRRSRRQSRRAVTVAMTA